MSRIRGKDTRLEIRVRSALHRRGFRFRKHIRELPGNPDVVFTAAKIAVFIDGDFWHGYEFQLWEHKVSDFWKKKISENRNRDVKNSRLLQEMGWKVIRLWQHDINDNFEGSINRITNAILKARQDR